MKKLLLTLIITAAVAFTSNIANAATTFLDNFNVTSGGGDVNYDYDADGRQSGTVAPLTYNLANGPVTVTNAGDHAGKANFDAFTIPSYLNPSHNFTESGDFSISFDLTRFLGPTTTEWTTCSFGTDGAWKFPHETAASLGFEVIFFQHGFYQVFTPGTLIGSFHYPELEVISNKTITVKFVVSQQGFPPTSDAKVAMFINSKPYPLCNLPGTNDYVYTYAGGFTNNFINFITLHPTTADLDNFMVSTLDSSIATAEWTSDADSGIASSKLYTHTVNLADDTNIIINGVPFNGSSSNQFGSNWEILTANSAPLGGPLDIYTLSKNPAISGNGLSLVSNVYYSTSLINAGGLVLTGLTPGLPYKLTLFSTGFEGVGGRQSDFATSDGGIITTVDQDEFGLDNGQTLTFTYIAPANGTFSISTTPVTEPWAFYAFANEIAPPPVPSTISASKGTFSDRVDVNWSEIDTAENYSLLKNVSNDVASASELSSTLTTNAYEDTAVSVGQNYYYWVKAANTGGFSATTGPAQGFTSTPQPATPSNISPASLNMVTAPVLLTASTYSDPGSYTFAASQWQLSPASDFSSIIYDSGSAIPHNSFTPPANASSEITNYWRVRYENEFNTWSDWSDGTSFILIPAPTQSVTFADSFDVPGSGDVNNEYNYPCRQTGNAAPLTYKTEGTTKAGGNSDESGWLTLGQNSGCSPNHSFTESGSFKIEFDVKPHNFDSSVDWFSLCFGKLNQSSLLPQSPSGAGLEFKANNEFNSYDGGTLLSGGSTIPAGDKIHVIVTSTSEDFEFSSVAYSVFANGEPMITDAGYGYLDSGFGANYITMFSKNTVSANSTIVNDFCVRESYDAVTVTNWTGDTDSFVDSSKTYTHTVNLNGSDIDINNVTFYGTLGGSHSGTNVPNDSPMCVSNGSWQIMSSGGSVNFIDGGSIVPVTGISGNSQTLANDFCWWGISKETGNSAAIKLFGLTPFSSNRFTIYTYAFEGGGRDSYFSSSAGGVIENVDQDYYGTGNGLILQYNYVASADGTFTIAVLPSGASSFHISGFSNERTGESNPKTVVDCIINFGEVAVGDNKILPMEIKNAGGGTVFGSISGTALPFSLATNVYSATAETSDVINIDFTPDTESVYSNVISLIGNDGTTEVMLTGMGIPEPVSVIGYLLSVIGLFYARRK